MTIPEIKRRVPMAAMLARHGLPTGRHLRCPFHDDGTASMQHFPDSDTVRCYAPHCERSGRVIDVIDFEMYMAACTKAEAIARCKALAGGLPARAKPKPDGGGTEGGGTGDLARGAVLLRAFTYMRNGLANAPAARAYLAGRGLGVELLAARGLGAGYVTGQMHHGKRASRELIASLVSVGLLSPTGGTNSRTGGPAYRTFAKASVCFPLRDADGKVAGLYFRHAGDDGSGNAAPRDRRHRYLRDRRGLYPGYPPADARRVLLCESVVDAASAIVAGLGEAEHGAWATLALYGTNGFTREHAAALAQLDALEEVAVMLDGDDAGRAGTAAVAAAVREARPGTRVTAVALPDGLDANAVLVDGGPAALARAVSKRAEVAAPEAAAMAEAPAVRIPGEAAAARRELEAWASRLDESDPYDLAYRGSARGRAGERVAGGPVATYRAKGFRVGQTDTLKVTLHIGLGPATPGESTGPDAPEPPAR